MPLSEMFGTFALSVGAAVSVRYVSTFCFLFCFFVRIVFGVESYELGLGILCFQVGMEFWARWAHRALWHASLWHMHEVLYMQCLVLLVSIKVEEIKGNC